MNRFEWYPDMVKQADEKAGQFITKDGRVIFIGGPSSGAGSATSISQNALAQNYPNMKFASSSKNDNYPVYVNPKHREPGEPYQKSDIPQIHKDAITHADRDWETSC